MKQQVAMLWANALESGKYRQATGQLTLVAKDGPLRCCCLGVLCEVAVANGLELTVHDIDGRFRRYDESEVILPVAVVEWAELTESSPSFPDGKKRCDFAVANDSRRKNFTELAQIIRANWAEIR